MLVLLAPDAQRDVDKLPATMRARLEDVITRLKRWPHVSGHKPMTGTWRGYFRLRMGDWRVIFRVVAPDVIIVRIAHRSKVYE